MEGIFIFALVLFVCASPFLVAAFLKHYFKYKAETAEKLTQLDLKLAKNENEILQRQVNQLEGRLVVLERIVTADGYELQKQINAL